MLYPQTGFTKGEVIDYYARIAPVLLPHLADRPLTRSSATRTASDGDAFFEKNAPGRHAGLGAHRQVEAAGTRVDDQAGDRSTSSSSTTLADAVWLANLAALELHVPQWTVGPRGGDPRRRTGWCSTSTRAAGAGWPSAPRSRVAAARPARADGLTAHPEDQRQQGHAAVRAPVSGKQDADGVTAGYAKAVAEQLGRAAAGAGRLAG